LAAKIIMDYSDSYTLIVFSIASFGTALLVVVGAVLGVMVGFLVFNWGWETLMNLPGGSGYNPSLGSGMSRFQRGRRNSSGGANLI